MNSPLRSCNCIFQLECHSSFSQMGVRWWWLMYTGASSELWYPPRAKVTLLGWPTTGTVTKSSGVTRIPKRWVWFIVWWQISFSFTFVIASLCDCKTQGTCVSELHCYFETLLKQLWLICISQGHKSSSWIEDSSQTLSSFCKVYSANYNGENIKEILTAAVQSVQNLAVDWINFKLYVLEAMVERIDMCDFDGGNRVTLVAENLHSPHGLALDPTVGWV